MSQLHILTDEQLVRMANEGSETAMEILIEKYKNMVKSKARLYYIVGAESEDVVQEGMIGLFKAICSYEEGKAASFMTYAEMCVTSQIISAIKKANRLKHQPLNESVSLSNAAFDDNQGEKSETIGDTLRASQANEPEALMLEKEVVQFLKASDSDLFSDFEWKVWNERLKGKNYTEIAETLGRSPKSIDNALQRIRKKLVAYMES